MFLSSLPHRVSDVFKLSEHADTFAQANRQHWGSPNSDASSGKLLTDVTLHHPGYVMTGAVAGKHLANEKNLDISFLARRYDRDIFHVCRSYKPAQIFSLARRFRSPSLITHALSESRRLFDSINSPEDIADITYEGILIGDLVYNSYLQKNDIGTINSVSYDILPVIFNAVLYKEYYERLLSNNDIRAIIGAQASYAKSGILLRLGLKKGIEVFERIFGPKKFTIRHFTDVTETYNQANRPSEKVFKHVRAEHREQAVKRSQEYLNDRLSGENDDVIVSKAYSQDKSIIKRDTLADNLGLDPDKPIAVLMTHVFLDAGHFRGSLFRDYVMWVRETLQYIRNDSTTNWIIKPHPGSERFNCEHTVESEFKRAMDGFEDHTVRIMPDNVSTTAVHDIADVVLTVRGSAGIEFPALGTPAIVASDCHYSGFGFAHEPDSKEAYFGLLDAIGNLPPLTDDEVECANVMVYLIFELMRVPSSYIPKMPKTEIEQVSDIWHQAADSLSDVSIKDSEFQSKVNTFVENNHQHLMNFDKIGL